MSISQRKLYQMINDDYADLEKRLAMWIEAAEEELRSYEAPRTEIYTFLFWAQVEFHRRRVYLKEDTPELELRGSRALRALESRGAPGKEAD